MSKSTAHRIQKINNISLSYIKNELGPWKKCPRIKCDGYMNEVFVRYQDHGPINIELECTTCNKIIKDPAFREKNKKNLPKFNRWPKNNRRKNSNVFKHR